MKTIVVEVRAPVRVHASPQEIANAVAKVLPEGTKLTVRVRA
jgi:hypothetical protein